MEETCAIGETPVMAEVGAAVIGSPTGSGISGFKTLGVGTNATETLASGSNVNETLESGTNGIETRESGGHPTEALQDDANTNETLESSTVATETLEGSSDGTETLESDTSKIETAGIVSLNKEKPGDLATTDGPTESANHFVSAVALDCTGPRFSLVEDKDLDLKTRQDISGNMTETESRREKTSPLPLRSGTNHQIESVNGNNVFAISLDLTENSAQEDVSAGCCPVSSTSDISSELQLKEEDDEEAARVKFQPREKCSDVLQAVEILRTSYRLSDVTIRKNTITWSSWNIADVVRGPHKETTWWKGRSLPRRMDAKSDGHQGIMAEEFSDDKEFHQEMADLCRKIDTRDRELVQILDEILRVAQKNNNYSNTAQTDPIEVIENQTTKTQGSSSPTQSAKGQGQHTAPDNDNNSAEALEKNRNPILRMMTSIRRRFSRRNRKRTN